MRYFAEVLFSGMFVMFKSRAGRTAERPLCPPLGVHEETSPFFPIRPFFLRQTAGWCWLRPRCRMQFMGQNTVMWGGGVLAVFFFLSTLRILRSLRTVTPLNPPRHRRGGGWGGPRSTPSSSSSYFQSNSGSLTIRSF